MKKNVTVSDLSGTTILEEENHVRVVIKVAGRRYELDANLHELSELISVARETAVRGRPKKQEA